MGALLAVAGRAAIAAVIVTTVRVALGITARVLEYSPRARAVAANLSWVQPARRYAIPHVHIPGGTAEPASGGRPGCCATTRAGGSATTSGSWIVVTTTATAVIIIAAAIVRGIPSGKACGFNWWYRQLCGEQR